ncbi:MAG: DNA repair protein RecN [Bacteroidia bacterium]
MLTHLTISNYALIDQLDISFRDKLNIITGETGAGKSILLGALGLILGNRADTSALLDPGRKCIVEGTFAFSGNYLHSFLKKHDLDVEPQLIMRREISASGKSRAFINDTPVNLPALREAGEKLVDIHSQHQTLRLSQSSFQMEILDAFTGHEKALEVYRSKFREYQQALTRTEQLKKQEAELSRDQEYLKFQLNEIETAAFKPQEKEQLDQEQELLTNAENIQQSLEQAMFLSYDGETSAFAFLMEVKKALSGISRFEAPLQQLHERVQALLVELKDIHAELSTRLHAVEVNEERINEVNSRLQLMQMLLKKHQFSALPELLDFADSLRQKLTAASSLNDEIRTAEKDLQCKKKEISELAAKLSVNRQKNIPGLEKELQTLLKQAGIPDAVIKIDLQQLPESQLTLTGCDAVEILFSANRGSNPGKIGTVASGGELSRVMLALKYLLAGTRFLPTMIFDEIDTGVSGETAKKVGQMIRKLSGKHQVICITHLPQIAALADHHFMVSKKRGLDATHTIITRLEEEQSLLEIAQMLAGKTPSETAIASARELKGRI